jgi:hypothetical protein
MTKMIELYWCGDCPHSTEMRDGMFWCHELQKKVSSTFTGSGEDPFPEDCPLPDYGDTVREKLLDIFYAVKAWIWRWYFIITHFRKPALTDILKHVYGRKLVKLLMWSMFKNRRNK